MDTCKIRYNYRYRYHTSSGAPAQVKKLIRQYQFATIGSFSCTPIVNHVMSSAVYIIIMIRRILFKYSKIIFFSYFIVALMGLDNVDEATFILERMRNRYATKYNNARSSSSSYYKYERPRLRRPSEIGPEMAYNILAVLQAASQK